MIQLHYKCTLLTDVALSSSPATEGSHKSLDYIPGSKFLGIVAGKLYDIDQADRSLDLFHNGKIRFGDAHILAKGNLTTCRTPFSWFYPKGGGLKDGIYLHHRLPNKQGEDSIGQNVQLKQVRGGYFSKSGQLVRVEQNFSIKSAYDSDKYRAANEQMYGYFALPKGSVWTFRVDLDEDTYLEDIRKALSGKHRIGRSSAAEYGLIEIEETEPIDQWQEKVIDPGECFIYAFSNLCFYDEYQRPILRPGIEQLKLPKDSIIRWDQSQIRTRFYSTWNKTRRNRDADRLIIEKGSVFVVELSASVKTSIFADGLGAHRSEGFGQVLINPGFLNEKNSSKKLDLTIIDDDNENGYVYQAPDFVIDQGAADDLVLEYLKGREAIVKVESDIDQLVNRFIKNYGKNFRQITSSQWGQVRNAAKNMRNKQTLEDFLFDEKSGHLYKGQSEVHWRKNEARSILKSFLLDNKQIPDSSIIDLTIKLANEMGKASKDVVA